MISNAGKIFIVITFLRLIAMPPYKSYALSDKPEEGIIIQQFYETLQQPVYWFSSDESQKKAYEWLKYIESADQLGIIRGKDFNDKIRSALQSINSPDEMALWQRDREITGIVLNFIKDLQEGNVHMDYDEVSIPRDSVYIGQLLKADPGEMVAEIVERLDCKDREYLVMKKFLADSVSSTDTLKYNSLVLAMNYRRYLSANHHSEQIVVNIPEAELNYYHNDSLKEKMRAVLGRIKSPTPVISSYINRIVMFPPWNVPHSIAVNELLPKVKKDHNYLEQHNFEVVDAAGNEVDDSRLSWNEYTNKNFPYFFRQSTGEGNTLGVLKFNMNNPFSIFLHDTSVPSSFVKDFRFLSHGCVRLEKPVKLANLLLGSELDHKDLKSATKNTESKTINLNRKVPVFIIYMPVKVSGDEVIFLKDVYGLVKQS